MESECDGIDLEQDSQTAPGAGVGRDSILYDSTRSVVMCCHWRGRTSPGNFQGCIMESIRQDYLSDVQRIACPTIISDQICGRVNPYENIFSPQRLMISMGIKNLGIDLCESVAGLTKGFLGSRSERCSHMGCHLEWNEEERTWDCPCHGSRFHEHGGLIDNPAKHPISRR